MPSQPTASQGYTPVDPDLAPYARNVLNGASFAVDRALGARLRPLHAELNLWGWVTLLIYGMAYHMLPRFNGRALRWPRLAHAQSWLAIAGGVVQAAAALLFALLIGALLRDTRKHA